MISNFSLQKDSSQRLMIESSRAGLYLIILIVSLVAYVFSAQFINWAILAPFYILLALGLCSHLVVLSFLDYFFSKPYLLFTTFIVDSFLISGLIFYSGTQASLFLFLHLVNIMITGLVFQTQGALIIALLTSSQFTLISLMGPDLKAMNYFFLLALNNIAYFLIAGLSGYLSEQLFAANQELSRTGLSLKETQELNQFVLSSIPSGLVSFNQHGQIYQKSLQALEILGHSAALENIFDLIPEFQKVVKSDLPLVKEELKKKINDEEKILGLTFSKTLNPVTNEPLWISMIEDQTQFKKMEYNLRQSEKMAAIGGLAAGIAHEIRNPLAGISGSVELLSQTTTSDDDRKLMKIILREIDRLNNLITEFLDYSRPPELPTQAMNVSALLLEVLESMKMNQSVRKDIHLHVDIEPDLMVLGQKDKLKQAFLNIVINAFQAMQDTPVANFTVRAFVNSEKNICLQFKDSGCGMKSETLKRMFEPFHTTKAKGTGLGLAVTHKIFENHQVQISVQSEPGQGTEFTLIFPCVKSSLIQK